MIGDWYAFRGHPYKCTASDIEALAECEEKGVPTDISEIPITAEILEKNGFEICNEDTDGAIQYGFGSPALGIDIWINTKPYLLGAWRTWEGETKSYTMVEELPINYVHELQHALRLCGIEKEIEL